MQNRLPLALFLSFLVIFGWMLLTAEPPEEVAEGTGPEPSVAGAEAETVETPEVDLLVPAVAADSEERFELFVGDRVDEDGVSPPGRFRAVFSNRGARLVSLESGNFFTRVGLDAVERSDTANWLPLLEPITTTSGETGSFVVSTSSASEELAPAGLDEVLWAAEELPDGSGVRFRYGPGTGVVFTKTIAFEPGTWHVRVRFEIANQSAGPARDTQLVLTPAGCMPAELGDNFYKEPKAVAVARDPKDADELEFDSESFDVGSTGTLRVPSPLLVAGVHNKYFAFLLREADQGQRSTLAGATYRPVLESEGAQRELVVTDVLLALRLPAEGATNAYDYLVYVGPKAKGTMLGDFEPHAQILEDDLGWFSSIGNLLLAILGLFEALVGNWGVAIILLTFCVRAVLFPLNRRSQTAMARYQKKMKRVQPKLEESKKKFANDPQKQREAQARIMQEEGAFPPLGGCLPIFLQLPIFFGLFSALRTSFDLRQAPFYGWITDLSRPDRLLKLDLSLPVLPDIEYLNLLPILMVVMWVLQQKGMPKPADEQAARMQKMMMFMPIVFGFLLYNYAAGLSLYMMTTSTIGIFEQKVIKKAWPIDDTELETKKKRSGCGPFAGMMENLAEKQKEQMRRMEQVKAEQRRQAAKKKKRRR